MAAGYALGPLFRESPDRRRKVLIGLGIAAVVGFIGLEALRAVFGMVAPRPIGRSA
jgi:hypothetical protein